MSQDAAWATKAELSLSPHLCLPLFLHYDDEEQIKAPTLDRFVGFYKQTDDLLDRDKWCGGR